MKHLFSKKMIAAAFACASVLAVMPISASAMANKSSAVVESQTDQNNKTAKSTKMEWIHEGGKLYCKIDGKYVKGWLMHEKYWYYFDNQGVAAVDTTITIDGKKFSFDSIGACTNIKHSK